jgi:hypothetical protein
MGRVLEGRYRTRYNVVGPAVDVKSLCNNVPATIRERATARPPIPPWRIPRRTDTPRRTMQGKLEDFVQRNADGWGHLQWEALLGELEEDGHDVSDPDGIGRELERLRLQARLEETKVKGLGPKRRAAVVERFGRLWDARQASEEELAALPGLNRSVAQALHRALR